MDQGMESRKRQNIDPYLQHDLKTCTTITADHCLRALLRMAEVPVQHEEPTSEPSPVR